MSAMIGPNDLSIYESPRPDLLRQISGLNPVEKGSHVLLEGVRSTQRLALGEVGGATRLGLWPAELKEQAIYLYGRRLARPMLSTALSHDWTAKAVPQLAFRSAAPVVRVYLYPEIDPLEYARRWEEQDLVWVGAHSRDELRRRVWPWLKSRGYASDRDDAVLEEWLDTRLGRRDALLRPALALERRCGAGETPDGLRREINAILRAAREPVLPA